MTAYEVEEKWVIKMKMLLNCLLNQRKQFETIYPTSMSPKTLRLGFSLFTGHEYAQDNLEFAASIEPENTDLQVNLH